MSLRDVQDSDLSVFFEHQQDPDAYRMAAFAPRDRDAFLKHWRVTVLGDASAGKQTVLINGTVAGNVVSWNQGAQR